MIAVLFVVFKIRTKVFLESAMEFAMNTPFWISWFGINIYLVAEFLAIFRTTRWLINFATLRNSNNFFFSVWNSFFFYSC